MDLDEVGAVPFFPSPLPPLAPHLLSFFLSQSLILFRAPPHDFSFDFVLALTHSHSALSVSLYGLQLSLREMNEGLMKLDFGTGPRMRISAEDFEVGAFMYV